jgi:hypothetical protein
VAEAVQEKTGREVLCPALLKGNGTDHGRAAACNGDALARADLGEAVIFLNADIIVSREIFHAISRRFSEGKKMVICAGIRTLPETPVPRHVGSSDLLRWALRNPHPVTTDAFYGTGKTRTLAVILFRDCDAIALRGFHLHPLALLNDRPFRFSSTVDWDIGTNFPMNDVHVVIDSDELSLAEISPPDKVFSAGQTKFTDADILEWAQRHTIPFHWWLFSHRILLRGTGNFEDDDLEKRLLASSGMLHAGR